MRPKKALTKIKKLMRAPSFTSQEAACLGVDAATLSHYVKAGDIKRIGHGVYRGNKAPVVEEFQMEELVEALQKTKGGVVCLISALDIYKLTEEIPRRHWIAIKNSTRHRADKLVAVIRMRNISLGRTEIKIGKITIPIFDRERTIVDSFRYLSRETAIKALKIALGKRGKEKIDLVKLTEYSKKLRVKINPYVMALTT